MDMTRQKEKFVGALKELGFNDPLLEEYYELIASGTTKTHMYECYMDFADTRMLYRLDMQHNESGFPAVKSYTATKLDTHPIRHGTFGDVDTYNLERRLEENTWHNNPDEFSELYGLLTNLKTSGNRIAHNIAERLEARHLIGTSGEKHVQAVRLKSKLGKSHLFQLTGGVSDVTARQAYNVMCGRFAIRVGRPDFSGNYNFRWFGLKPLRPKASAKEKKWFEEVLYEGFDLGAELSKLPVREMETEQSGLPLIRGLMEGDLASATINIEGQGIPVYVSVNPEKKDLNIYGVDLKPININTLSEKPAGRQKKYNEPASLRKPGKRNGF